MPRYDFDQGLPDPTLYPVELLAQYYADALALGGSDVLDYFGGANAQDMAYGHLGLRDAIATWLTEREGCGLSPQHAFAPDNVLLANGSTNGIAMVVNTFLGRGDALIVEELSYPYTAKFGRAAGATVFTVPVDECGMVVDALPGILAEITRQGLHPRLVYTIATFHAPSGTVLPTERRRALIDIARTAGMIVLDDNCYYHLWYDQAPPPSLLSLAGAESVIQSGSFSKYLAPGLRMAWLAGDTGLIAQIAEARQDFAVSQLTARVVERFVRVGQLDRHLVTLRGAYGAKRDAAARALSAHCAPLVTFRAPRGGIFFWLDIDRSVDDERAMAAAAARGVGFRAGARFLHGPDRGRFLRLSVAQTPLDDIEPGIAILGDALKEAAS